MPIHIIIDGYNFIRQSPRLSRLDRQNIQWGRERLIEELARYKKRKRHRITVVFDGSGDPSLPRPRDRVQGIDIAFSRTGESADGVIKRMAVKEKEGALVVSSDRDIAGFAAAQGATVVSSRQFDQKLVQSAGQASDDAFCAPDDGWNRSTKKKGPSRRLSKRKRKHEDITRKL